jgi:hypothetical protein
VTEARRQHQIVSSADDRRHFATAAHKHRQADIARNARNGLQVSIGMLVADCTAKLIRELDSYSGIGEAPSNVVASLFATAAPAPGLYSVASVKLMHVIQFPAKAAFRHEHFHDVRISSLGGFRSRGTFARHGS